MSANCGNCVHWRAALEDALALAEIDKGICRRRLLLDAMRHDSVACANGMTATETEEQLNAARANGNGEQ